MDIYADELADVLVLCDMNINWSDSKTINRRKYANMLKIRNHQQLVKSPMRVTNTSSTIIDHVVTNRPDLSLSASTIDCGVSDHAMTLTNRKKAKIPCESFKHIFLGNWVQAHIKNSSEK